MRLAILSVIVLLVFSGAALPHHSFATHYRYDEHVRITGVISYARLANPHSFFTVDVTNEFGDIEHWEVEANSVPLLARAGIVKGVFDVGDKVTITGMRSRDPDRQLMFGLVGTATDGKDYYFIRPDWDTAAPPITLVRGETEDTPIAKRLTGIWKRIIRENEILNLDGETPLPLNEKGRLARSNYNPLQSQMRNCIPPDIPSLHTIPYLLVITTSDSTVELWHEYYDIHRHFYPGGDARQAHETAQYGVSTSRLETDAFYIETSEFPAMSAGLAGDFDFFGRGKNIPSSEGKYLAETYRLLNDGQVLELTYTIDDREYLAEPYTGTLLWARQPEDTKVFTMDCEMAISQRSTDNAVP